MSNEQIFEENQSKSQSMEIMDYSSIAVAETIKARVQAAYIMAMKKPRNQMQSRDRILQACRRPSFAARVEYAKPVGTKKVRGPSVRFAELAIREWENIQTETMIVYEDIKVKRIKLLVTDLETNSSHSKEITVIKTVERKKAGDDREIVGQRKNTYGELVYVVKATDDEIYNKEAALISKALRNEGLRLIPADIIDESLEIARETLLKRDAEDPEGEKKKIFDAFSEIGINPKELQKYIGHERDKLSPAELQDLRGVYRAIRDGDAKWEDYINPEEEKKPVKSVQDLKDKLKKDIGDTKGESHNNMQGAGKETHNSKPAPDSPKKDEPEEDPRYNILGEICVKKNIPTGALIELTGKLGFHDINTPEGIEEFLMYAKERISGETQTEIQNLVKASGLKRAAWEQLLASTNCAYIWELTKAQANTILEGLRKGK